MKKNVCLTNNDSIFANSKFLIRQNLNLNYLILFLNKENYLQNDLFFKYSNQILNNQKVYKFIRIF